jgi:hypothetical protein
MVESSRRHDRLVPQRLLPPPDTLTGPGGASIVLRLPPAARWRDGYRRLVHFHGAPWVPLQAMAAVDPGAVAVAVQLGAGSGRYDRAYTDPAAFDSLLAVIDGAVRTAGRSGRPGPLFLSGFSAGHGAIRAILRTPRHAERIDGVLLLDGLHTDYVPARRVIAEGGSLDPTPLAALAAYARTARGGRGRLVVTHSEIFPGTFASTTETVDWLLGALGVRRSPVLRWGPVGMQQTSEARAGGVTVLGFAGNSAPDHVDHLHGMPAFLRQLVRGR